MMDTRFAIADFRVSQRVAQYTLYRRGGGDDARGEGGHLGATWLTLAEKVTLAQGAIGGCRAPLLPRFSSIVCMLRGEPRAMGVTSQRKAKSTFSAGCCPRGLLNVAARLLR